ncbi:hypothetical protein N7456_007098 [Penicillium angulare]|uniref:Ankyrin n=1 Tax=Penicillium angulare TaxID=116970 RepID=A0A9W9FIW4_9EURO|nr:hypothetical protein N7456_007098 [Penicillium angulare]
MPPFHRAILNRRLDIARLLLTHYHASPNSMYRGTSTLLLAIKMSCPQAVNLILEHHPRLSYTCDFQGQGPLSIAVAKGNFAIVERLLHSLALNVNDRCTDGMSALMYAVEHAEHAILSHLLTDPRVNDSRGRTALWHALDLQNEELVQLLLDQDGLRLNDADDGGLTPLARAAEHQSPRLLQMLLRQLKICINTTSSFSPLWAACRAGSLGAVQNLLTQRSIQINVKAPSGTPPLHVAVINQHLDIVSLLLSQGEIALNEVGPSGCTALMFAAANGYTACVERLLRHPQIDLQVQDPYGYCAFSLAILNRHARAVDLLSSAFTHLSTAKSVAQSPLDPITEKRGQRDQQAHENEFFRTCCTTFRHLATDVVDITQKLVLEEHFHPDQFIPVNARLCRAALALWAALDASRVEEDRAERIWMQELDMPTASEPSSEWI